MKYMGSKRMMLKNGLGEVLRAEAKGKKRIVDLFCGSASVAWFAAQRLPVPVLATDLQQYSVILASAVLGRTKALSVTRTLNAWLARSSEWRRSKLAWKDAIKLDEAAVNTRSWAKQSREICAWRRPKDSPVWKAYGGYYFSPSQALIFDSLIATMPRHEPQKTSCHAAVIMAASKCVAAPGHTAQPFKATKTAGRYLREAWLRDPVHYLREAMETVFPLCALKLGYARVADANNEALRLTEADLVFIDPPYSGVQYSRFYHVLETIAAGKCGTVSGTGRYPPPTERPGSRYSRVSQSREAFDALISKLAQRGATAIVTFPSSSCSNGISGDIVEQICSSYFRVQKRSVTTHFSTMGGNNAHRSPRHLTEELILVLKP